MCALTWWLVQVQVQVQVVQVVQVVGVTLALVVLLKPKIAQVRVHAQGQAGTTGFAVATAQQIRSWRLLHQRDRCYCCC